MKLPKQLFVGYNLLKKSRLALKKQNDDESLSYFKKILNKAQPVTEEDKIRHQLIKGMYNENKFKFLNFIRHSSMECFIMWTESKAIVNFMNLRGIAYIRWQGKDDLYDVTKYVSKEETSHPVAIKKNSEIDASTTKLKSRVEPKLTTDKPSDALKSEPDELEPNLKPESESKEKKNESWADICEPTKSVAAD